MRVSATRELLAPRTDVWRFLAEPYHLSDWWPGISGVQPDRRGLAAGARWAVRGDDRPTLFRGAARPGLLLVRAVEEPTRLSWHLTRDGLDVEIELEETRPDRTRATVVVESRWLFGSRRSLPERALARLHALVQTAAEI